MAVTNAQKLAYEMDRVQVVDTKEGSAMLIGGRVYHVTGPDGNAASDFAEALHSKAGTEQGLNPAQDVNNYLNQIIPKVRPPQFVNS